MIVENTWTRTLTIFTMISSTCCNMHAEKPVSTESSAEYLQKVMLELRDFNLPPSLPGPERPTGALYFDVDDKHYNVGKRHSNGKWIHQSMKNQNNLDFETSLVQPVEKNVEPVRVDQTLSETAVNHNMYYQVPGTILPSPQKSPEASSALTKAELAAVYKHAFERGNAVSLNALANVLRHRQPPKVTTGQAETGETQPMYTYYFYPLKHFMNDVRHGNGLIPGMDLRPEINEITTNSQKDMSNPLFVAISGFIGMAVLFMIGVMLFPRISDFRSRVSEDEKLIDLTKTVGEAISHFNCTDEQDSYKSLDRRLRILCQPVKIQKPSSVVLLTRKSMLQKGGKRRRKISSKCKVPPCKRDLERSSPT